MLLARKDRLIFDDKLFSTETHLSPETVVNASSIVCCSSSLQRDELETFIHKGYQRNFNANLTTFMPVLVGLKRGAFRAAMGIRDGAVPFFVEQYFDSGIASFLLAQQINCPRENLVEIGNLFSTSFRYMLPLMIGTCMSLYQLGKEWAVCTLTKQLQILFQANGMQLTELGEASRQKLVSAKNQWGTYYDTQPKVFALSLSHCLKLVENQPALASYRSKVQSSLPRLTQQLAGALL